MGSMKEASSRGGSICDLPLLKVSSFSLLCRPHTGTPGTTLLVPWRVVLAESTHLIPNMYSAGKAHLGGILKALLVWLPSQRLTP